MAGSCPYEVRVRVKDLLEPAWSSRLAGLVLTPGPDGTTVVSGRVVDQAALHGVLDAIRDLGLSLISVRASAVDAGPAAPERR
jgi:hypothetical protein